MLIINSLWKLQKIYWVLQYSVLTCNPCITNFQVVLQGSDDIASRAIELLKETFTSLGPKLRASQVCVPVHH